MAHQSDHRGGPRIASLLLGLILGSYVRGNRHQRKSDGPDSPLQGLDARQAMIAVSFGRFVGLVAIALFLGFYVYTRSQL